MSIKTWIKQVLGGLALVVLIMIGNRLSLGARISGIETRVLYLESRQDASIARQEANIIRHELDRAAWLHKECLDFYMKQLAIPQYLAADCAAVFQRLNLEYPYEQSN